MNCNMRKIIKKICQITSFLKLVIYIYLYINSASLQKHQINNGFNQEVVVLEKKYINDAFELYYITLWITIGYVFFSIIVNNKRQQ